jgi:hypothetical protein
MKALTFPSGFFGDKVGAANSPSSFAQGFFVDLWQPLADSTPCPAAC